MTIPAASPNVREVIDTVIAVFVFNIPQTAKVIWRPGHGLKSGEAGYQPCHPWFTRQVVYPLHHGCS